MQTEERILPGKAVPAIFKKGKRVNYDDVGISQATCPFCFHIVRSDEEYVDDAVKCEHFHRITGGCGVAAAFYFYNPSMGRH